MSERRSLRIFWVILIVAALFRVTQLDVRPFHHDEGVNNHFINELFDRGYYPYSHENYHGPLYFYLLGASVTVFGDSEAAFRLTSVVSGLLLVAIPFFYRRRLGDRVALLTSLFFALSPSMIFYSRYAIHEIPFVAAELWFGLELLGWLEDRSPRHWLKLALAAALFVTLKETFVIALFGMAVAVLISYPLGPVITDFRKQNRAVAWAGIVFSTVVFFVYTGGFRWFNGAREMLQAIPQWVGRGTKSDYGHFKPFAYYGREILLPLETHLAVIPVLVILYGLWLIVRSPSLKTLRVNDVRRQSTYFAVWAVVTFLVYSWVPYKTPWLVLSVVAPAALSCGKFFDVILSSDLTRLRPALRHFALAVLICAMAWTTRAAIRLDYRSPAWLETALHFESLPFGDGNIFSYVHTTEGMRTLAQEIRAYLKVKPDAHVIIGVDGYWPLPYYLKGASQNIAYERVEEPEKYQGQYDIIVAEHTSTWVSAEFDMRYHRLTGASETHAYFRRLKPVIVEEEHG